MPTSPGFVLWRISNLWQRSQREALEPLDLTPVQFVLLESVVELRSDEPVTQKRLADHAKTDPMMTSQVVRTLESKGLLRRSVHPGDKRAVSLEMTARGRKTLDRAIAAVNAIDVRFFDAVDPGSLVEALEALVPAPSAPNA